MEPSSSCSSPGEQPYEGEMWTLELMDDFSSLDGEVGKRLNQLIPVPVSFCMSEAPLFEIYPTIGNFEKDFCSNSFHTLAMQKTYF